MAKPTKKQLAARAKFIAMVKNKSKKKKLGKHPRKYVRKTGKTAGKTISRAARKRFATIVEKQQGPRGGSKQYRFPIPPGDKAAARNALARLPQAMGMSPADKKRVVSRVKQVLGHMTPSMMKYM